MLLVNRTRAIFRSAELGFLGVWVLTCTHTPRRCGQDCSAGLEVLYLTALRPLRTNWLIVGIFSARSIFRRWANVRRPQLPILPAKKDFRFRRDASCKHSSPIEHTKLISEMSVVQMCRCGVSDRRVFLWRDYVKDCCLQGNLNRGFSPGTGRA